MKSQQLWFTGPHSVEVREKELEVSGARDVLVRNVCSAISAGTEMLVFRNQLPDSLALDESIEALSGQAVQYPLQYGYACVGKVEAIGEDVEPDWFGKTVFSFQPHCSSFVASPAALIPVPADIDPSAAVFLANMETAVNFLLDASPKVGERVLIVGQGIVGLLTSGLLAQFPLAGLFAVESIADRQRRAEQIGVNRVFDINQPDELAELHNVLRPNEQYGGADLIIEVSGSPEVLNLAVDLCGYAGRILVGSWYGTKRAAINLGERFHRNRMQIVSSQVSSIAPENSGRWDPGRRFEVAWEMIRRCQPEQFISHRFSLPSAGQAYELLDKNAGEALQVVFDYGR